MKFLIGMIVSLLIFGSVNAADPTKNDFNILNNRVDNIQKQVDDLKSQVDSLHKKLTKKDFLAGKEDCSGCDCGCKKTGTCNCGKDCQCNCGCGETGNCNCGKKKNIKNKFTSNYIDFLKGISSGKDGTLYIGVKSTDTGFSCQVDHLDGFANGVYHCYMYNGVASMEPKTVTSQNCPNGSCPTCPQNKLFNTFPSCPNGNCPFQK